MMKLPTFTNGTLGRQVAFTKHLLSCVVTEKTGIIPAGACGNGRNERWVRDSWGNADFTGACRNHDRCYETCRSSKDDCDAEFKSEMREACRRSYSSPWHAVQREACLQTANGYHSAVHRMGGDSYRAAQRESGC